MSDFKINETRLTYQEARDKSMGNHFICVSTDRVGDAAHSSSFSNLYFSDVNNGNNTFTLIGFKEPGVFEVTMDNVIVTSKEVHSHMKNLLKSEFNLREKFKALKYLRGKL